MANKIEIYKERLERLLRRKAENDAAIKKVMAVLEPKPPKKSTKKSTKAKP